MDLKNVEITLISTLIFRIPNLLELSIAKNPLEITIAIVILQTDAHSRLLFQILNSIILKALLWLDTLQVIM